MTTPNPTPTLPKPAADVVPDDLDGLLYRLLKRCDSWDRWIKEFNVEEWELREKQVQIPLTELFQIRQALASRSTQPEGEAASVYKLGELLATAEHQKAYWMQRQLAEKSYEDGLDEDGNYTPRDDMDAESHGYCNGRYSEADWWLQTIKGKIAAASKPLPHPEAAASGDVTEIERLMDLYGGALMQGMAVGQGTIASVSREALLEAIRSLAYRQGLKL